jgi:hypothetical protein
LAARTILGVIVLIAGLALAGFAAFNFNTLFFVQKMLTKADIPAYNRSVVLPLLLGFVVLLDGSIILGLKRRISILVHLLGNIAWLYAVDLLYGNLAIPILDVTPYQLVFYAVVAGMVFFVVGFIINDLPHRKQKQTA